MAVYILLSLGLIAGFLTIIPAVKGGKDYLTEREYEQRHDSDDVLTVEELGWEQRETGSYPERRL